MWRVSDKPSNKGNSNSTGTKKPCRIRSDFVPCSVPCFAGYRLSQKKRERIEECFGWLKTIALLRKVRHRGTLKADWMFTLACAAYNLVRMRNLMVATVPTA